MAQNYLLANFDWIGLSMFETIVLRRHQNDTQAIDAGLLAETLLFYDNVHLVADGGTIAGLFKQIGKDNVINLLKLKYLKITYVIGIHCTLTRTENSIPINRFACIEVGGREKKRLSNHGHLELTLESALGKSGKTKKFYNQLCPLIRIKRNLDDLASHPRGLAGAAEADLADNYFVNSCISDVIKNLIPDFRMPYFWHYRSIPIDNGFFIDTNYDFEHLNTLYRRSTPKEEHTITAAYLINHLFDARADLQIAAGYTAEIATTEISKRIIAQKLNDILVKREKNQEQITIFQSILLQNGHAIASAINSGERSFSDFIQLLDKARRMRAWLKSLNPDDHLLEAYYRDTTSSTWIENLPARAFRFALTTGIQAVFPLLGTALAGADAALVDKLRFGWRPDQFVNRTLKPFASAY